MFSLSLPLRFKNCFFENRGYRSATASLFTVNAHYISIRNPLSTMKYRMHETIIVLLIGEVF